MKNSLLIALTSASSSQDLYSSHQEIYSSIFCTSIIPVIFLLLLGLRPLGTSSSSSCYVQIITTCLCIRKPRCARSSKTVLFGCYYVPIIPCTYLHHFRSMRLAPIIYSSHIFIYSNLFIYSQIIYSHADMYFLTLSYRRHYR